MELIDSGPSLESNWDSHGNMRTHIPRARDVDQPIAALLIDLRRGGLLDETLVVWTSEFGRLLRCREGVKIKLAPKFRKR